MSKSRSVSVRLSPEEYEWLRRKAHWDGVSIASLFREQLNALISDEGYLRPPNDEPQDFGFEKEMMQFVVGVQEE